MPIPVLDFDPYVVLLGIKASQRPLDPYQLLNLMPLDADRSRVRTALERQKLILEQKRIAADPETWQYIHDELESAATVLLDPERRAVVDAAIRRRVAKANGAPRPDDDKPRAATGDAAMVPCPGCRRANPHGRRFCGDCGHGLWETCPQCSAEIAAHEKFCGQCGLNVRDQMEEQSRQIQEQLALAADYVKQFQFDRALSALRGVASLSDPRVEQLVSQALNQIEQVETQQRQALAEAASATEQALKLVRERSFEWAAKVLEKIPPPLRDAEASELLSQAQFSAKELTVLVADIRESAQQGRTWELFPKIDRLLTLNPAHAAVLNLADQLRSRIVKNARKRLADHYYGDAVQALSQVPLSVRTDEVRELLEVASELAELLSDLKQSPYATPSALALAQRLVKLAPANEEAARLCEQFGQRAAVKPNNPRLAVSPWTRPRERSAVGPPIEWLGNFVRAQAASEGVAQTLREHPGEFFLAMGLGLRGLDEAAIDISLLPPEKGSMLGKLASLPLLGKRITAAWGIDLGSYALKALKLVKDASGNVKIADAHYILLSKPLAHPDAEGNRPAILTAALSDLAGRVELKGSHVAAALSGHQVLGRFFDLPPLPAKKIAGAVEYEARHQIPIDLAELCWGWTQLGQSDPKTASASPSPVMVLAARRSHVEDRLTIFESAAIRVDSLHSDCVSLHNALRYELDGTQPKPGVVALFDVGADETNFVVTSQESLWFRSFGLGGHSVTAALLQAFQLTYDRAEQLKRQPALGRRYHQFREAISPLLVQFAGEIDRSLASFARQSTETSVERLYALGGGTHLHGLLRHCISGPST